MTGPEAGALIGVTVIVAGFLLGVVKLKRSNSSGSATKFVLKSDCEIDRGEIREEIKGMRTEQVKQGKTLARIDERTELWAKKNGFDS